MAQMKNFRVRVMKYAWQLWRATKASWRECMLKAWQLYRLTKQMREGMVRFVYRKTNGEIRHAVGTLVGFPTQGRRITKPSYKTITYWDVTRGAFRCFRTENLMCIG